MKRGSITPFCALSMMLIASLLFALLESARVYGLDRYATLRAENGVDSVCAEFQPLLWKEYGLLFLDGAYGTEEFNLAYVSENLKAQIEKSCQTEDGLLEWIGIDLFGLRVQDVVLEGYALATDDNGELFLNYVAERMKETLPIGLAEDIYEQYILGNELEKEYDGVEESVVNAEQTLRGTRTEEREQIDMLESVAQMQKSFTLQTILEDVSAVSQKASQVQSKLQTREKTEGTMKLTAEKEWYRKLLVLAYLEEYFASYTNKKEGHFLEYEMEYVLCGKDTEWENLDATFDRILLVREAANLCYLLQDEEKMQLADGLANLLGLLVEGNPVAIKVFQAGIVGAWAYLESVLDVRALIAGDAISLVKQESEWTTDVANIITAFSANAKAKNCEGGWKYADYLKMLLFFSKDETLAFRMMEAMELSLQSYADYQNCKMNQMLVAMKCKICFESEPVFFSLVTVGDYSLGTFGFEKNVKRSYIP